MSSLGTICRSVRHWLHPIFDALSLRKAVDPSKVLAVTGSTTRGIPLTRSDNPVRHSGPQGHVQPLTIIDDPSAWLASDYPDPAKLAYVLTVEDITELDAAVAAAIASGREVQVGGVTTHHWQLY